MALPWPTFETWNRIREQDRGAISDVLTQLLADGALIGETGSDRQLFLLAREHQSELAEYLAPLHLELVADPDKPIFICVPCPVTAG